MTGSCQSRQRMGNFVRMSVETVTLKIPKPLYERLQVLIQDTGFRSPTEFVLFVLRDLSGADTQEIDKVHERLRSLGYL